MKLPKKIKRYAMCLLCVILLYVGSIGPVSAFLWRSQDYIYDENVAEMPQKGSVFYSPVYYLSKHAGGVQTMVAAYIGFWECIRSWMFSVLPDKQRYIVPVQGREALQTDADGQSTTNILNAAE